MGYHSSAYHLCSFDGLIRNTCRLAISKLRNDLGVDTLAVADIGVHGSTLRDFADYIATRMNRPPHHATLQTATPAGGGSRQPHALTNVQTCASASSQGSGSLHDGTPTPSGGGSQSLQRPWNWKTECMDLFQGLRGPLIIWVFADHTRSVNELF
jgi:hypothetical protein